MIRKGFGRIYVEVDSDITKVHRFIKEIDQLEFSGYMPKGLVTTFANYPETIYLHKFDQIDAQYLAAYCWARGVKVLIVESCNKNLDLPKRPEPSQENAT